MSKITKQPTKDKGNWQHGGRHTRLYVTWCNLKGRCYNPKNAKYPVYGARGITVCKAWRTSFATFQSWALANGYKNTLQIDRKNNDKGYSPSNCRWVTARQNANNRSTNSFYTAFGETKTIAEWSRDKRCGVSREVLRHRLVHDKRGWTIEQLISNPPTPPR